tara:strand:- start:1759 stop:1965 length:207 start_codon:yes stop_codon:yes gene_type:complete
MALSQQVEESLREAQENLRNALSFSSRTEPPYVNKHIADILAQIENLVQVTELVANLDEVRHGLKDNQ